MSSASAVKAGRAFVEIFADRNPLTQGLRSMEGQFKAWGKKVSGIGKSVTTGATAAFKAMSVGAIAAVGGIAYAFTQLFDAQKKGQLSASDSKAAKGLQKAWDGVMGSLRTVAVEIGSALAPMVTDLANRATKVLGVVARWIRDNRELIVTAVKIGAVLLAVSAAAVVVGYGITAAGVAMSALGAAAGLVLTVLGALLSPMGLVVAAIVGIAAAIPQVRTAAVSTFKWVSDAFMGLVDTAKEAWGGISAALAAGDLQAAAKVAWLGVMVEWQKGVNFVNKAWLEWKGYFLGIFDEATAGIAIMIVDTFAGIESTFVSSIGFLSDIWTKFLAGFQTGWATAQGKIAEGFAYIIAKAEGLDPAEVLKNVREDTGRRLSSISSGRDAALSGRQGDREKRLADIERDRQGANDVIGSDLLRQQQSRADAFAKSNQAAADALQKAKDDFAKSVADAKALKPSSLPAFAGGDEATKAAQEARTSVVGTRSGAAAAALGGGLNNPAVTTAKGVSKLVDLTQRQTDEIKKAQVKAQ